MMDRHGEVESPLSRSWADEKIGATENTFVGNREAAQALNRREDLMGGMASGRQARKKPARVAAANA